MEVLQLELILTIFPILRGPLEGGEDTVRFMINIEGESTGQRADNDSTTNKCVNIQFIWYWTIKIC